MKQVTAFKSVDRKVFMAIRISCVYIDIGGMFCMYFLGRLHESGDTSIYSSLVAAVAGLLWPAEVFYLFFGKS